MKLNLGCGSDVRQSYVNVDFRPGPDITVVDLSKFPWPFKSNSVDEILMLDFLEHFPYKNTEMVLNEVWRILKIDSYVDIQVPDFECCSLALLMKKGMLCNKCGWEFDADNLTSCKKCCVDVFSISHSAMMRLYGGQDYDGNFHYTAFTKTTLLNKLSCLGFYNFDILEKDHQFKNWNFKIRAYKHKDMWSENE